MCAGFLTPALRGVLPEEVEVMIRERTANGCNGNDCCGEGMGGVSCRLTSEKAEARAVIPISSVRTAVEMIAVEGDGQAGRDGLWRRVRGGVMLMVACITSLCCTPLIVPVVVGLVGGTPAAVWMGENLGWIYGGLTLISVVSGVVGWRWMQKRKRIAEVNDDRY